MQKHPIKNGVLEKKTQMLKRRVLEKEDNKERLPLPHPPPHPPLLGRSSCCVHIAWFEPRSPKKKAKLVIIK